MPGLAASRRTWRASSASGSSAATSSRRRRRGGRRDVFEARSAPCAALSRAITARGAFKLYAGAAEGDARLRLYGTTRLEPGGSVRADHAVARRSCSTSATGSSSARRAAGETVAGGVVLDTAPPASAGRRPARRLRGARAGDTRRAPALLVDERGRGPRGRRRPVLTGSRAAGRSRRRRVARRPNRPRVGRREAVGERARRVPRRASARGRAPISTRRARAVVAGSCAPRARPTDAALADALLDDLERARRHGPARRRRSACVAPGRARASARPTSTRCSPRSSGAAEPTPPTVAELVAAGIARDVIDAAARAGLVVRISPETRPHAGPRRRERRRRPRRGHGRHHRERAPGARSARPGSTPFRSLEHLDRARRHAAGRATSGSPRDAATGERS